VVADEVVVCFVSHADWYFSSPYAFKETSSNPLSLAAPPEFLSFPSPMLGHRFFLFFFFLFRKGLRPLFFFVVLFCCLQCFPHPRPPYLFKSLFFFVNSVFCLLLPWPFHPIFEIAFPLRLFNQVMFVLPFHSLFSTSLFSSLFYFLNDNVHFSGLPCGLIFEPRVHTVFPTAPHPLLGSSQGLRFFPKLAWDELTVCSDTVQHTFFLILAFF